MDRVIRILRGVSTVNTRFKNVDNGSAIEAKTLEQRRRVNHANWSNNTHSFWKLPSTQPTFLFDIFQPVRTRLKGGAASDAAASIPKALSPKLLDSKGNLNVEKTAIDLHSNAPAPMKITCLTIGSRGDVQPYIALCQKLNELGHTCSIATHEKFRDWIVQSDIGFRPVAGDPEELIKHCTQNGKISLSY
ncbi:hypothetical protein Pst134EA_032728 [Puccinia striiformis f. sp. tritici]|uniref:uncharacterized protein n=1 Tax=Puccinia striiformis f. sp. tritici TaxID=168172 RepID=UPI002008352F|nr:uncharacterized protein Pst134EA_032728 [Puccinia striiformis f. sp. tritici]KAH9441645.1 hypothetical protein Pst134EA_032728 [Puccinia striiformis f. sp. tritici]